MIPSTAADGAQSWIVSSRLSRRPLKWQCSSACWSNIVGRVQNSMIYLPHALMLSLAAEARAAERQQKWVRERFLLALCFTDVLLLPPSRHPVSPRFPQLARHARESEYHIRKTACQPHSKHSLNIKKGNVQRKKGTRAPNTPC